MQLRGLSPCLDLVCAGLAPFATHKVLSLTSGQRHIWLSQSLSHYNKHNKMLSVRHWLHVGLMCKRFLEANQRKCGTSQLLKCFFFLHHWLTCYFSTAVAQSKPDFLPLYIQFPEVAYIYTKTQTFLFGHSRGKHLINIVLCVTGLYTLQYVSKMSLVCLSCHYTPTAINNSNQLFLLHCCPLFMGFSKQTMQVVLDSFLRLFLKSNPFAASTTHIVDQAVQNRFWTFLMFF